MTLPEISNIRLYNQQIAKTKFNSPKDVVKWMGAMQAQDFNMSKWAIGIRTEDCTEKQIVDAYNKGEIIRTHVMRPTWHYVSPDDIYWMLNLTAPRIKSSMKSRNRELELDGALLLKTNKIIEKALEEEGQITREEFSVKFNKEGIKTDNNRLSHILFEAELDSLICSGPIKGNKITYMLLKERVKPGKTLTREESLAELAQRYFTSHGPAKIQDFAWWSGLSLSEARKGLELVKNDFLSEEVEGETYWFAEIIEKSNDNDGIHFIPAFDEFLISYKDRTASLSNVFNRKTVSINGIFYPIIVAKGQVAGLWKKVKNKNGVIIETNFFVNEAGDSVSAEDLEKLSLFTGGKIELRIPNRINT